MNIAVKYSVLYGLAVWVELVLVSLLLGPIEAANSPLFESLKSILLAVLVTLFTVLYLKKVKQSTAWQGFIVGAGWAVVTVALDSLLYAFGFFGDFTYAQYCNDVATSYVMMPLLSGIITGFLKAK